MAFVVVKLTEPSISEAETSSQRENSESPALVVLQGAAPRKPGMTSDSDSAYTRPHQETWRVIGGGVMLGTAASTYNRGSTPNLSDFQKIPPPDGS